MPKSLCAVHRTPDIFGSSLPLLLVSTPSEVLAAFAAGGLKWYIKKSWIGNIIFK